MLLRRWRSCLEQQEKWIRGTAHTGFLPGDPAVWMADCFAVAGGTNMEGGDRRSDRIPGPRSGLHSLPPHRFGKPVQHLAMLPYNVHPGSTSIRSADSEHPYIMDTISTKDDDSSIISLSSDSTGDVGDLHDFK